MESKEKEKKGDNKRGKMPVTKTKGITKGERDEVKGKDNERERGKEIREGVKRYEEAVKMEDGKRRRMEVENNEKQVKGKND